LREAHCFARAPRRSPDGTQGTGTLVSWRKLHDTSRSSSPRSGSDAPWQEVLEISAHLPRWRRKSSTQIAIANRTISPGVLSGHFLDPQCIAVERPRLVCACARSSFVSCPHLG
jgi:hypothetical protein